MCLPNLGTGASQILTKHDGPWGLVAEIAIGLVAVFEQFNVATPTVASFLEAGFILNDQGFRSGVNGLGKGGRDGMMGSFRFCNETLLALDSGCGVFFHVPLANIGECLTADGGLLCGLGRRPTVCPGVSKLFDEVGLNFGGL